MNKKDKMRQELMKLQKGVLFIPQVYFADLGLESGTLSGYMDRFKEVEKIVDSYPLNPENPIGSQHAWCRK